LICADAFLWLTHQKLDHPEKSVGATFRIGGQLPPLRPPANAPVCCYKKVTNVEISNDNLKAEPIS